jgi:hypothetical protein
MRSRNVQLWTIMWMDCCRKNTHRCLDASRDGVEWLFILWSIALLEALRWCRIALYFIEYCYHGVTLYQLQNGAVICTLEPDMRR